MVKYDDVPLEHRSRSMNFPFASGELCWRYALLTTSNEGP
ncbi:hypothetical protein X947_3642 [Burkholderia pseudomallei MSHR7334]|nr:hypothetical protein X948_4037 [Burkholderia pseudomallei MSHR5608]KGS82242.1 hypothetical protein X947_3642 [Burkholderia pseudomallei MSHR7334]